ncbi:MAG TPA: hypothetical protein VE222_02235, partial [Nitrospiraceae bacterium]|nr:hypothetical protein [Nitrospiraceae bacterium]
ADGFVFGLISCAYLLLRKKVSATVQAGAIGLTAAVAYFLWRYSYYGYILPNTYYAKVSGPLSSRVLIGLAQLRDLSFRAGILPYLLVIVIMLATVAQTWWKDRRVSWERVPIEGFLATCWIYYWLYIGGDHIAERMLLILFPLGLAGLLRLLRTSATRQVSAFVVLLVVLIQLTPLSIDERFEYSWTKYDMWITLGDFLSDGHAGEVLAIEAAGKVPYFSGMPTIDMLGLNDEYLAHKSVSFFSSGHNKYDADYVLGRKPDLIAAWINPDTLDMSWGLLRSKYEIAGYRIKYLVSCEEDLAPGNVVEVLSWKPETIQAVTYRGFHYAVLARLPSDTAPPRP